MLGLSNKRDIVVDLEHCYFSSLSIKPPILVQKKCLTILARYLKTTFPIDRYFDLVEIESSIAEGLFNSIKLSLESCNIPLTNVIDLGAHSYYG